MKKVLVLFLIICSLLLFGCQATSEDASNISQEEMKNVMNEFDNIIAQNNTPKVLIEYINSNIQHLSTENANKMIIDLESCQNEYMNHYTLKLSELDTQKELLGISPEEVTTSVKNAELNNMIEEILESGYKFVSLEGDIYPIIDYEKFKKYSNYISKDLKEYINIMAVESNKIVANDGGLTISWDELAQRILNMEIFLKTYDQSAKYDEMKNIYLVYFESYIRGTDNTPIFDWDKVINENKYIVSNDVISSYNKLIEENSDTYTEKFVQQWLEYLETLNYELPFESDTELEEYNSKISNILSELKSSI